MQKQEDVMARRKRFYLSKRKKKHGTYWYVSYIDLETGKQQTAKSVEVLRERLGIREFHPIIHMEEACIIAQKALDAGIVQAGVSDQLFTEYCEQFWDWDRSQYIRRRNQKRPNSIGLEYTRNMQFNFKKHAAPNLPSRLKLTAVSPWHLEQVLNSLLEAGKLSSGTISLIFLSMSIPLKEAYRQGLIPYNPASRVEQVSRMDRSRGILTPEEKNRLGTCMNDALYRDVLEKPYFLAISLAMSTGMRIGEIRALHKQNIQPKVLRNPVSRELLDKVIICESVAPYTGFKGTKGKYSREICIPHKLGEQLLAYADENPKRNNLVFWNQKSAYGDGPITDNTLRKTFYSLLKDIGIDERQRKERNITFHSLRHFFNTTGKDLQISQEDRMMVMGHRSTVMNERYTHITDEQLIRVSSVTNDILNYLN